MQDLLLFRMGTHDFSPFSEMSVNLSSYKATWRLETALGMLCFGACPSNHTNGLTLDKKKLLLDKSERLWDAQDCSRKEKNKTREIRPQGEATPTIPLSRDRVIKDFRQSLWGSFDQTSTRRSGETQANKIGTNDRHIMKINTSQQQIIFLIFNSRP